MTGIERLRKLSKDMLSLSLWVRLTTGTEKDWDCCQDDGRTVNDELLSIANQIEQEARAPFSRVRVLAVISNMESRVSDEGGSFGALVARWARELRGAVCSGERDPAEDVSMSAYDLLPEEEREAIAWVRERGGIEGVSRLFQDADSRRVELCAALGIDLDKGWSEAMAAMRLRLMPEGCEWIKYDTGEPVPLGGEVTVIVHDEDGDFDRTLAIRSIKYKENGVLLEGTKNEMVILSHGERVKRPATKVLDADGVEVEVGDDLYSVEGSLKFHVSHVDRANGKIATDAMFAIDKWADPSLFTHRAPVLAADGEPLEVGQTVWDVRGIRQFRVLSIADDGEHGEYIVETVGVDRMGLSGWSKPSDLTHQRPVLDADGNRIEPAMDVWWVCEGDRRGVHAERLRVESIGEDGLVACDPFNGGTSVVLDPAELYVKKPALDADGVLCREGDEVWEVRSHRRREIVGTHYRDYETGEPLILCDGDDAIPIPATCVTHTKPEPPDSYCRLYADMAGRNGNARTPNGIDFGEFMRRCRALAERERGE